MQLPGPHQMPTPQQVHCEQPGVPGHYHRQHHCGEVCGPDSEHIQGEVWGPQAGLQEIRTENKHDAGRTCLEIKGPRKGPTN